MQQNSIGFSEVVLKEEKPSFAISLDEGVNGRTRPFGYDDYSVIVSGNGEIVVLLYNSEKEEDGQTSTYINVYGKKDGAWKIVKGIIYPSRVLVEEKKFKVCISHDGTVMAVYVPPKNNERTGCVDIITMDPDRSIANAAGGWKKLSSISLFSQQMVLSGDGKTLIAGVLTEDNKTECYVFKKNEDKNTWDQNTLPASKDELAREYGNYFISSIATDYLGETIAVGDILNSVKSTVKQSLIMVFSYKQSSPNSIPSWVNTETIITDDEDQIIGSSVSMSGDGCVIATEVGNRSNWLHGNADMPSGLAIYTKHFGNRMIISSSLSVDKRNLTSPGGQIILDYTGQTIFIPAEMTGRVRSSACLYSFHLHNFRKEDSCFDTAVKYITIGNEVNDFQYPGYGVSTEGGVLAIISGKFLCDGRVMNTLVIHETPALK